MSGRRGANREGIGRLSIRPAADDGLVPRTLQFIREQLPAWRDDPSRPRVPNEKTLNSTLSDFLETRARELHPMVRFKHEAPQSGTHTADIGVHGTAQQTLIEAGTYTIYDPFLVLEAKRLPAPSRAREREYVTGPTAAGAKPTGGIQRFKLGLHGGRLTTAAMIAYVERHTGAHWRQEINRWISELAAGGTTNGCSWSVAELLRQVGPLTCQSDVASAVSTHGRSAACITQSIEVHHLWIFMSPRSSRPRGP
jgi:hypothetical protein